MTAATTSKPPAAKATASQRPARRGDLALLITAREGTASITLGVVTSVTRDGLVKAWDEPTFSSSPPRPLPLRPGHGEQVLIVPAAKVDVQRAMTAYREHVYKGHDQIEPFRSEKEARWFLAPFAARLADTARRRDDPAPAGQGGGR